MLSEEIKSANFFANIDVQAMASIMAIHLIRLYSVIYEKKI